MRHAQSATLMIHGQLGQIPDQAAARDQNHRSHMLNEEPRLFFMHFWAQGEAPALAHGFGAALAVTNVQR